MFRKILKSGSTNRSEIKDDDPKLSEESLQRRNVLLKFGLVVAGISIIGIGGTALLGFVGRSPQAKSGSLESESNQAINVSSSKESATFSTSSVITIKVVYFGMPTQTIGAKQEYVTLKGPALLKDVISEVTQRHPALISMMGAMQILIDGNPAEPDQQLANKDEIDFIPLLAGG